MLNFSFSQIQRQSFVFTVFNNNNDNNFDNINFFFFKKSNIIYIDNIYKISKINWIINRLSGIYSFMNDSLIFYYISIKKDIKNLIINLLVI